MRRTHRDARCVIYDDVLPPGRFRRLWAHLQGADYHFVHESRYKKTWRPSDGAPLRGQTQVSRVAAARRRGAGASPIDHLLADVSAAAARAAPLVGRRGQDWVAASATAYLYPPGTGLSWHADEAFYTGSYVYYAHPTWSAGWGGELLIAHAPAGATAVGFLDDDPLGRRLLDEGLGTWVMARPNRLVLVGGAVLHRISPVSSSAGDHVRASVAGFFLSPSHPRAGEA